MLGQQKLSLSEKVENLKMSLIEVKAVSNPLTKMASIESLVNDAVLLMGDMAVKVDTHNKVFELLSEVGIDMAGLSDEQLENLVERAKANIEAL